MSYRIPTLLVFAAGTLLLSAANADANPFVVRPLPSTPAFVGVTPRVMPGSDPRTWSPYPLNRNVLPGSDPRTWSPYPLSPNVMPGSDPRTWSPYPIYPGYRYDNGPIPYWRQNPYWRQTMPAVSPNPYVPYVTPYGAGVSPFLNPYTLPVSNPYSGSHNLYD
jgi:hypothetical protein